MPSPSVTMPGSWAVRKPPLPLPELPSLAPPRRGGRVRGWAPALVRGLPPDAVVALAVAALASAVPAGALTVIVVPVGRTPTFGVFGSVTTSRPAAVVRFAAGAFALLG